MTSAVSILQSQRLAELKGAYRKAVVRKRLRFALAAALFFVALALAGVGAEVNLRTFFTHFGNFVSYFDRILKLDDGAWVWTNIGEWLWGWRKWLKLLGETLLISYVGMLIGTVFGASSFAGSWSLPARFPRLSLRSSSSSPSASGQWRACSRLPFIPQVRWESCSPRLSKMPT